MGWNVCYEIFTLTKSSGDMIPGVVKIGGTPAEISGVSQKSRTSFGTESLSSTGEIGISVAVGAAMSSKNAESD